MGHAYRPALGEGGGGALSLPCTSRSTQRNDGPRSVHQPHRRAPPQSEGGGGWHKASGGGGGTAPLLGWAVGGGHALVPRATVCLAPSSFLPVAAGRAVEGR